VLSAKELNEPLLFREIKGTLSIENDNDLNHFELKQIRYWKPERVGDVVFNFWD
jgi:hypothetical protein